MYESSKNYLVTMLALLFTLVTNIIDGMRKKLLITWSSVCLSKEIDKLRKEISKKGH